MRHEAGALGSITNKSESSPVHDHSVAAREALHEGVAKVWGSAKERREADRPPASIYQRSPGAMDRGAIALFQRLGSALDLLGQPDVVLVREGDEIVVT